MLQRMMKSRFEPKDAAKVAAKPAVVKAPAKRTATTVKAKNVTTGATATTVRSSKPTRVVDDIGFAPGDHVVYPTHGVGRITAVESQVIGGQQLRLLVIQFEKDRMTLRVPVTKAKSSGLRRLSTRKEMQTALVTLKGRSRVKRTMWSRRAQEYEAKINSGDPRSIAEVVRDLHRNADQPDQSFSERQMYQAALDRLVRELAVVEHITEQSATERLETILKVA
jgi:CarD family transcriptional regulator